MPPVFSFCDLDDTLFRSGRKAAADDLARAVAFTSKGLPISFQSREQAALYSWLAASSRLIVTTGRSSKWLSRITLPFNDYAICSFGGVILSPDGEPQPDWYSYIQSEVEKTRADLLALRQVCETEASRLCFDVRVKVVKDRGLDLHLSIKHNKRSQDETTSLAVLLREQLPAGWWMHLNGRNMALCPPFLGKDKAVAWFLDHLAGTYGLVLGVGDSLSDLSYMGLGHGAVIPVKPKSQIFATLSDLA